MYSKPCRRLSRHSAPQRQGLLPGSYQRGPDHVPGGRGARDRKQVGVGSLPPPGDPAPAPPRLPRRRGAAGLRRDHGDVCGDDSRGNDSRGNDSGGNHTRVGGTPSLPGTRDPRAPDVSRRLRLFPRRRPRPELGAGPRVGAPPGRRGLSGVKGDSQASVPRSPCPVDDAPPCPRV